jgi:hypothetical protein
MEKDFHSNICRQAKITKFPRQHEQDGPGEAGNSRKRRKLT